MVEHKNNKNCKDLAVKSNQLIEARYRLTTNEQKVIYKVISEIGKDDTDFRIYTLKVKELADFIGTRNKNFCNEIKKITKDLVKKTFTIKDLQVSWFSSAEYKNNQGVVEIEFSIKLKPLLLQLKEAFTKIDINEIVKLKGNHSLRIFELVKESEFLGERKFSVEELRYKLGLEEDEYPLYSEFKRNVLKKAHEEINNKTGTSFDYEEIKGYKGKVVEILFKINSKDKQNKKMLNEQCEDLEMKTEKEYSVDFTHRFKSKYGGIFDVNIADRLKKEIGVEKMEQCLEDYKNHFEGRIIKNVAGDFYTFCKKGYQKPVLKSKIHNFEQREYTDKDFEKFYANLEDDR